MGAEQQNEEELYEQYEDRLRRVALRCASKQPGRCSVAELMEAAWSGLRRASQTYDPTKGEALWNYAEYFVRGHILRLLAAARSDQEKLVAMLLRSQPEADESGAPKSYWQSHAENVLAAFASLTFEQNFRVESVSPEDELLRKESNAALGNAVASLPERERHVIEARWFHGESLAEIAAKLDIDDSVISKNHKAALRRLRVILSESPPQRTAGSAAPPPSRPRKATVMTMRPKAGSQAGTPPRSSRET